MNEAFFGHMRSGLCCTALAHPHARCRVSSLVGFTLLISILTCKSSVGPSLTFLDFVLFRIFYGEIKCRKQGRSESRKERKEGRMEYKEAMIVKRKKREGGRKRGRKEGKKEGWRRFAVVCVIVKRSTRLLACWA